ncbi:MAG: type IV toxin-antitoxin system AbiEi family antitoxin domain-containing protein [Nitriliruptoraceae bacterium]|nr:type IV toxin-antitoxin system AbiEi family antitoxin domain-containing protein [Nitriliruptoraceae bacterium]
MGTPPDVHALAEAQLGAISRRQLECSLGDGGARRMIASGALERLHRGVYRFRGSPPHRHQAAFAAALRVGDRASVTGAAAVELTGPPGIHLGVAPPLLLVAPPVRAANLPVTLVRDPRPDRPISTHGEVRVVGAADGMIDLLRRPQGVSPREVRLAFDQLRWSGQLRPGQLTTRATELGVLRAIADDELLEHDEVVSSGPGERRLERVLDRFRPGPVPQHWITPYRRVDFFFATVRLGIEYQGRVDHGSRSGRSRDRARDEELTQVGVRLVYVTADDLRDEQALIATIAAALSTRAAQLGLDAPRLVAA